MSHQQQFMTFLPALGGGHEHAVGIVAARIHCLAGGLLGRRGVGGVEPTVALLAGLDNLVAAEGPRADVCEL